MKTQNNNTYVVRLTETSDGVKVDSVQKLVKVLGKDREKYKPVDKRQFTNQHLNTITKFSVQ